MNKIKTMKNIFKISAVILIFGWTSNCAWGQTDYQCTNYMHNQLAVNPAFAASSKDVNIALLGRSQWTGLANSPQSFTLDAYTFVPSVGGVGITMYRDKLGYELNTAAKISYAYKLKFADSTNLTFGLSAGITSRSIELDQLVFESNEPLMSSGDLDTKIKPDFGFGARFMWKKLDLQFSATHISSKLDVYDYNNIPRHFYGMASYTFRFTKNFSLIPSVFIKSNSKLNQVDVNVRSLIADRFMFGLGYRVNQAAIVALGMKITDNISFVYSYDYVTGSSNALSRSNHEIVLIGRLNGFNKGIKGFNSKASF
jgi:type IX secretion system PorP/SprF family membrane protein